MSLWRPGDPLNERMSPNGRVILPSLGAVMLVNVLTNHPAPCQSTTSVFVELDCEEILRIGPMISGITCYTNTVGRTANHSWALALQWSNDFKNWFPTTPANLFTPITANGPSIPTEYTTTTNFGLGIKLSLNALNSTGSANENAFVSCTVALRFKT